MLAGCFALRFFVLTVSDCPAGAQAQAPEAHEAFRLYPGGMTVFYGNSLRGADAFAVSAANAGIPYAEILGAFAAVNIYAGVELRRAFGFAVGHNCRPLACTVPFGNSASIVKRRR